MQNDETILIGDANSNDLLLMDVAFESAGLQRKVQVVRDGREVLDYLQGLGKYGNRAVHPLPSLVILDLQLPRVDGLEVLSWIRRNPALAELPVVILTGSPEERQRQRAYSLGASEYITKPLAFQDLVQLVCSRVMLILQGLGGAQLRRPQAAR